jgi:hypothetical protein
VTAVALGAILLGRVPTAAQSVAPTTAPAPTATATAPPNSALVTYSGQLLDVLHNFAFFTTGDGFRLDPAVKITDLATGKTLELATLPPLTGKYARAAFDPAGGRIVALEISPHALPSGAAYETVQHFAVALSTPAANPDLGGSGNNPGYNGKPVLVTFTVEVPPTTPQADDVYIATDASGWSVFAIKMDRVDALHYRVTHDLPSGTVLNYRYTRGSWRSAERGQNGLELPPHHFVVRNLDVMRRDDVVYHWGDEDASSPAIGPDAIPTPFSQSPFVLPSVSPRPGGH